MGGRQYKSIKLSYTEQLLDNFLLYLMRQTAAFAREKEKRTEGTKKKKEQNNIVPMYLLYLMDQDPYNCERPLWGHLLGQVLRDWDLSQL